MSKSGINSWRLGQAGSKNLQSSTLKQEPGSFSGTQDGRLTFLHGPLEVVQHAVVVNPAEHLLLHQSELLAGRQLPLAGEAGKAGQVIHVSLCPADPVSGVDVPATTRAPSAVSSAGEGHDEQIRHAQTSLPKGI